jgi:iron complex transport system substrate-binding protein
VPAVHSTDSRPRRAARPAPIASVLLAILAVLVAACGAAATPKPTVPADATGSLAPAETATPAASEAASPSPAFPTTLTGDDGQTITLAEEPDQVVSLTPAETEILFAIGAGDKLVGKVEDIANFPPEAGDVPVVGTFAGVDIEKIVSLGSDLVIAGGSGGTPQDAIDKLRDLKIPVLVVYAADVDGALADITLTGQAVGEQDAADALVATMQDGFDQVKAATAGAATPKVFYETGDQPSIYGIADESVYAEMIGLAGGAPVTTGSATNWEMPVEKLVDADPDLIILGDSAYGVTAAAVAKRPGWAGIKAVKAGAILGIDDIVVTRPGPRLVDGLLLLVAAIHPELGLGGPSGSASPAPSGG